MRQCPLDHVEYVSQVFGKVFRQESQDCVPVLLQQAVLMPIATVGVRIAQVEGAVDFDRHPAGLAQKIDFHTAAAIEWNRQRGVQPEPLPGGIDGLQPVVKKCLTRTASATRTLHICRDWLSRGYEQVAEWNIDTVEHKAAHAGGVVALPQGIGRKDHGGRPTRNRASRRPLVVSGRSAASGLDIARPR